MTTEQITARQEAVEKYLARIANWCRKHDEERDRIIVGIPWVTRDATYAAKPEIRSAW